MRFTLDYDQYAALARQTAAEGCVLLKNEKEALPIRKGETVSMFGRIAFTYYKSGTGSGGMVNAPYVTNILGSLKECKDISVNEELEAVYQDWIRENPFDMGEGWAQEPWSQKEMPVSEALAQKAAASSDLAVVVLGRTAGEDMDNSAEPGSYLLTAEEEALIKTVCSAFKRRQYHRYEMGGPLPAPGSFVCMAGRSGGRTCGGRYSDRRSEPLW